MCLFGFFYSGMPAAGRIRTGRKCFRICTDINRAPSFQRTPCQYNNSLPAKLFRRQDRFPEEDQLIQSVTCSLSQSHHASTPSPVFAEMGKISSFGFLIGAYSVTLSISKSK